MTKDILKQYLDLKAEKEQLELEIKEFYEDCIKPSLLTGMPRSKRLSDPTAEMADQVARLHTKLLYKRHEVSEALEAIEDAIDKLRPKVRRIMRDYYINDKKWEEIAIETHYSVQRVWQLHGECRDISVFYAANLEKSKALHGFFPKNSFSQYTAVSI